jgi:hypothetical protein
MVYHSTITISRLEKSLMNFYLYILLKLFAGPSALIVNSNHDVSVKAKRCKKNYILCVL